MRRRAFLTASLAALACACATPMPQGRADLLDFLQDGRTTRADAYLKLGFPAREVDHGRIVSWRLRKDEAGYFLNSAAAAGWLGARYELVVIFSGDVVDRHSLVEIRGP